MQTDSYFSLVPLVVLIPLLGLLINLLLGRRLGVWHGDIPQSVRTQILRTPPDVLLTTPESLEVMLISERTDAKALFQNLSAVVIDEVHAFAGDDRGAHLAAILERLVALCERDVQRIGLSATVGNPLVIGEWLRGSSKRPFRLVDPPNAKAQRELHIDYCDDVEQAALGISHIARGKKSLVFVESRSKAERVAQALGGSGVEAAAATVHPPTTRKPPAKAIITAC